jgi:outer membrane protein TolC
VLPIALTLAVSAPAAELTLDQALALALTSPAAVQAELTREQATARLTSAHAAYDPVLTASGSASSTESAGFVAGLPTTSQGTQASAELGLQQTVSTGTTLALTATVQREDSTTSSALSGEQRQQWWTGQAQLSLTQDLLAPLRASADRIAVRQAGEQLEQAEVTKLASVQQAIEGVAEAWWSWWAAVDSAEVAHASLEHARQLEERTRAWLDAGQIAQLELDRVTADRLAAERDALQADAEVRRTRDALAVLMGQRLEGEPVPAGSGRAWPAQELDHEAILADVLQRNLDLALARSQLQSAGTALADARDARLPTLDLTGTAGMASLSETAADAVSSLWGEEGLPQATVALDLAVPLGGRAARGEVRLASAERALALSKLEALTAQVEADTRAALDQVLTAQQSLVLAQARLEVARATERGEQARVNEGLRRLDELLDATSSRELAEADLRTAQIELARAELELASLRSRVMEAGGL